MYTTNTYKVYYNRKLEQQNRMFSRVWLRVSLHDEVYALARRAFSHEVSSRHVFMKKHRIPKSSFVSGCDTLRVINKAIPIPIDRNKHR